MSSVMLEDKLCNTNVTDLSKPKKRPKQLLITQIGQGNRNLSDEHTMFNLRLFPKIFDIKI